MNYESLDNILFVITPEESRQYDYLRIPVIVVQSNGNNRDLELFFRISDFYLEGFILQNNYYHFSDSHITEINNINSNDLQLNSAYRSILPEEDQNIHWQQIFNSFNTLTEIGTNNQALNNILSASLANVILVTAEAMRFRYIFNLIAELYL
ncbi:ribosome-inactivating family protein [Spiroplasma endosymbiont of Tipula paludosa]|uniref:ribosome-inactivating family protein n=1 Tax=Spiroplasma endosymbiont of Tipula paludosa TaxID=3066295 RepID=UPI0035C8E4C3